MDTHEIVGFIGLGDMGQPMAVNIAKAGFRTLVCDRRPAALEAPVEAGAEAVDDVATIAARASIIAICVLDDRQVLQLVAGPGGVLDALDARPSGAPHPIVVVHSTVTPATMEQLSSAAGDAALVVDAPVSGGRAGSVAGTLTVMVSGPEEALDRCASMFDAVGSTVVRVGSEPGMGSVGKLCNNIMALSNNLAMIEALELAGAYGIEEQAIVDIANVSTGMSWFTQHPTFTDDLMEHHTLAESGQVKHLLTKDLWDAVLAARSRDVRLIMSALGAQAGPEILEGRMLRRRARGAAAG